MLVSGLLEKEETGCFPEGQALQKPQVVWARSVSCPRMAMGGPASGTCHVRGTVPQSHLRQWPSPLTVSTHPQQGRHRAPTPGTLRAHLGAAQGVGTSLGVGHGATCPASLRPCRGPECSVPGFLEAVSGDAVLSLGGRLQTLAQGLSSSTAPNPALASPSPCPRCCHHGSLVQLLMAELRAGVSGEGLSTGRSCLNSKLAPPGAVSRQWAGPGLPYGGGQVGSQQWPLVRGP